MKRKLNLAILLFLGLSVGALHAETVAVGSPMPSYTLADQFGEEHTLAKETRYVLVVSDRELSKQVNAWLAEKGEGYLGEQTMEYVSDISPMPKMVTKLFALPKMKKYPFKMLLWREDGMADTYPRQEGRLALFALDEDHMVTAIHYLATPADIETQLGEDERDA